MSDDLRARVTAALEGRYEVDRELGHGGMAVVFLARDRKHQRQVAIKVLRPEIAQSVGAERFLREIEIAAKLAHPHILPVHDSGQAGDVLFYVMPYVEGETLRDRLEREKQLSVEDALRVTHEIADALSYAHSQGIVHRDIKPENVLFSAGHAVVSDFGIARAITAAGGERLTESGLAMGSPFYMSPEQASGEMNVDARSDIYALGCVLYEMMAGEPPFTGPTLQTVLAKKLAGTTPELSVVRPNVPVAVALAVTRALANLPADRFGTATQFMEALSHGAGPTTSHHPARIDTRTAASIGLMFVVIVAVALVLTRGGKAPVPRSVAVLYFDNLSADTLDAYLADGLNEEISSRLGDIDRLQVKSRKAARRFRGTDLTDLASVSRQLGVSYIVEGSVRRAADRVRATVSLVDAQSGFRVWGDNYDRAAGDLLALQEDIARQVALQIAGQLLPAEEAALTTRPTTHPEAYDHFLRGNYYLTQRTSRAFATAIAEYETAVRLDPSFSAALARAALGYAFYLEWGWNYHDLPPDSLLARGLAADDRALAQDSNETDAWMARGYLQMHRYPRTLKGALGRIRARARPRRTQCGSVAPICLEPLSAT